MTPAPGTQFRARVVGNAICRPNRMGIVAAHALSYLEKGYTVSVADVTDPENPASMVLVDGEIFARWTRQYGPPGESEPGWVEQFRSVITLLRGTHP